MNRIRQGWDALRRGRRSGVSLVIALCAVAVLIGLSLSIVYSSSMLLSRANRKIGRERCYQLAQSFAQVLDSELTAYNTERTDLGGADDKWPQTADGSRTFYQYANSVLENLDAYDADDPEHTTYYYSAGDEDDDYGKVTVMLRKQNTDSEQNPASGGENPFADVSAAAYYYNAVLWAVENDVAKGVSETAFAPNDNCTRAQIVTLIYRCRK